MYSKALLSICLKDYGTIKEIVNNLSCEEINDLINANQTEKDNEFMGQFKDMVKEFCEEDYPMFLGLEDKIQSVTNCEEYTEAFGGLACSQLVIFDGFVIGTQYNGTDRGDCSPTYRFNDNVFLNWLPTERAESWSANGIHDELIKVMEHYSLDVKHIKEFRLLMRDLCRWFNNMPWGDEGLQ